MLVSCQLKKQLGSVVLLTYAVSHLVLRHLCIGQCIHNKIKDKQAPTVSRSRASTAEVLLLDVPTKDTQVLRMNISFLWSVVLIYSQPEAMKPA